MFGQNKKNNPPIIDPVEINTPKDDEYLWEVRWLWHEHKHPIKLSIHKHQQYRNTYCCKCGKAVLFERMTLEDLECLGIINDLD